MALERFRVAWAFGRDGCSKHSARSDCREQRTLLIRFGQCLLPLAPCRSLDEILMTNDITIRSATSSDVSSMTALLRELGCDVAEEQVQARLARLERSAADRVFLAVVGGIIVGLLGVHVVPLLHRDGLARLTALIVTEAYRGQGIGSQLLCHAEAWAVDRGCTQIELNSGDHHAPAHDFYRRRGYRADDRRFLKEEEVLAQ